MDKEDILHQLAGVFNDPNFKSITARTNEIDFGFHDIKNAYQKLAVLLDSLNIEHQLMGMILSVKRTSRDSITQLFPDNQSLFYQIYQQPRITDTCDLIVVQEHEGYAFDHTTQTEFVLNEHADRIVSWMKNYRIYSSLLRLFKHSDFIKEFDDTVKSRLMIIDNGKEKNNVIVNYKIYDSRIFTKDVQLDLNEIEGRLNDASRPNNSEWLAIFRHNIVNLIAAQEDQNKTFIEIFLNISFIIQNTGRDYEIYLSGFSFDKISKELKEDRQKYFSDLNQAQDKIKSQVIAVPLAVGTSIYAFFQLNATFETLVFLLIAIAIYIGFIWWYLILYEKDLTKLKKDIAIDSENFQAKYPKVYNLFKDDFKYINGKVKSVKLLSYVIRGVILVDWIMLAVYVFLFYQQHPAIPPPFAPKFLNG